MNWNDLLEELQRGGRLIYTDLVPGGWSLAIHFAATPVQAARIFPIKASLTPEQWLLILPSIDCLRSEDILRSLGAPPGAATKT